MKTAKDLCDEYITSIEPHIKSSTAAVYRSMIKCCIAPYIGDLKADEISSEQVLMLYDKLLQAGHSGTHVHSVGVLLRATYKYAAGKYAYKNVFAGVPLPKIRKRNITVLSREEQKKVLESGGSAEVIALLTGLRIGEVCGLMGGDIKDGWITVRRTVQRIQKKDGGSEVIISSPKSESSRRMIPVLKRLAPLLSVAEDKYIIGGGLKPVEPRTLAYRWKTFCKNNGISEVKFHTLRHTFATNALETGIDIKTLSELLGHSSVEMTMNIYCHPSMQHKQECMAKIFNFD